MDMQDKVIFTGFVPDEDLTAFYQNAKMLVLVSLYEGFGLTVLEAMSYGTPVVVSNVSSLPEVAGDAGVLVNPQDIEDICRGITQILTMDESAYKTISKKSKLQANKFSWEKAARKTLEILEVVAKQK